MKRVLQQLFKFLSEENMTVSGCYDDIIQVYVILLCTRNPNIVGQIGVLFLGGGMEFVLLMSP